VAALLGVVATQDRIGNDFPENPDEIKRWKTDYCKYCPERIGIQAVTGWIAKI